MRYEQDPNLSLKAKGALRIIETVAKGNTGEIEFSFDLLTGKEGRDSKRNALKELIKQGYLKTELERNYRGQIMGNRYFVRYAKEIERV